MSRLFRQRRGALSGSAFSAVLIGGFSLGLLAGRQTQAQADPTDQPGNHEVSQKFLVSARVVNRPEMQNRRDAAVEVWKEHAAQSGNVPN